MFKMFKKKNTLYCFTPEVMIATFVVEISLAAYVFIRRRTTFFGRLSAVLLVLLGIFQFAEYQICGGLDSVLWAKIGIIAISLLPIIGLHLILKIWGSTRVMKWLYAAGGAMILYIIFSPVVITGATCGGNYVIFKGGSALYSLFSVYYFSFLFFGIWLAFRQATRLKGNNAKKDALYWMVIGYLSFIMPMAIVLALYEYTLVGVTSIMCGFAVIFALILAIRVIPLYHRETKDIPEPSRDEEKL